MLHNIALNILLILLTGQLKLGANCKDASPTGKCRFIVRTGRCDAKGDECQLSCGICSTESENGRNICNK